ncbi:MAG: hypothetical protein MI867_13660 [Pseudomonadales bacterium]|nr:hypothetical protein [Pseudomonadales bacterium]
MFIMTGYHNCHALENLARCAMLAEMHETEDEAKRRLLSFASANFGFNGGEVHTIRHLTSLIDRNVKIDVGEILKRRGFSWRTHDTLKMVIVLNPFVNRSRP